MPDKSVVMLMCGCILASAPYFRAESRTAGASEDPVTTPAAAPGQPTTAPRERRSELLKERTRELPVPQDVPATNSQRAPQSAPAQIPEHIRQRIVADVQSTLHVSAADVVVRGAEEVLWADGSMGCPQPGMEYTQREVPGYSVEIVVGEKVLDYRASRDGVVVRCDERLPASLRVKKDPATAPEQHQ